MHIGSRMDDEIGDAVNRKLALCSAIFPRRSWHAVDDAARFILRERRGAKITEPEKSFGAVLAHSSENAGDCVRCGAAVSSRFEQQIYGGALMPDLRTTGNASAVMISLPLQH